MRNHGLIKVLPSVTTVVFSQGERLTRFHKSEWQRILAYYHHRMFGAGFDYYRVELESGFAIFSVYAHMGSVGYATKAAWSIIKREQNQRVEWLFVRKKKIELRLDDLDQLLLRREGRCHLCLVT